MSSTVLAKERVEVKKSNFHLYQRLSCFNSLFEAFQAFFLAATQLDLA